MSGTMNLPPVSAEGMGMECIFTCYAIPADAA
jgi:hypothetical protein